MVEVDLALHHRQQPDLAVEGDRLGPLVGAVSLHVAPVGVTVVRASQTGRLGDPASIMLPEPGLAVPAGQPQLAQGIAVGDRAHAGFPAAGRLLVRADADPHLAGRAGARAGTAADELARLLHDRRDLVLPSALAPERADLAGEVAGEEGHHHEAGPAARVALEAPLHLRNRRRIELDRLLDVDRRRGRPRSRAAHDRQYVVADVRRRPVAVLLADDVHGQAAVQLGDRPGQVLVDGPGLPARVGEDGRRRPRDLAPRGHEREGGRLHARPEAEDHVPGVRRRLTRRDGRHLGPRAWRGWQRGRTGRRRTAPGCWGQGPHVVPSST